MGAMTSNQLDALSRDQAEAHAMQIFLTGYLGAVCSEHLAEPNGPLRSPIAVELAVDEHSNYLPRFVVELASGIRLRVRIEDSADVAIGDDVLFTAARARHRETNICPGCQVDVSTTALVGIVYTFRVCTCELVAYEHLVEQLWHAGCYLPAQRSEAPAT